jgi:hypothetical protein
LQEAVKQGTNSQQSPVEVKAIHQASDENECVTSVWWNGSPGENEPAYRWNHTVRTLLLQPNGPGVIAFCSTLRNSHILKIRSWETSERVLTSGGDEACQGPTVRTKKGKVLTTVKREKPGSDTREHAQLIFDDTFSVSTSVVI